jgi:YbbR domain-containing protein
MKKRLNSTPFIIVAVIMLAIILVIVINQRLNSPKKPNKSELETNMEQSLIDEIETIRIENTTEFDLIDIEGSLICFS